MKSLLLVISKNSLLCLMLAFFSFSGKLLAQNAGTDFGLYSYNTQIPLTTLPNNRITDISFLGNEKKWANVKLKGGIPAWIKAQDAVLEPNNTLRLSSETAKVYIEPKGNSRYLLTLNKGYTTPILSIKESWYQVLTPSYLKMKMLLSEYKLLTNSQLNSNEPIVNQAVNSTTERVNVSQITNIQENDIVKKGTLNQGSNSTINLSQTPLTTAYSLTPGDVISISVFGEPDMVLNNQRIGENGLISFPLIGQVVVKGKSTQQVESSIESLLSKGYLRDPKVNVVVNAYRPLYVRGAVTTPGSYEFTEGLTVAKVLTLAGGVIKGAETDTLKLYRDDELFVENLTVDSQTFIQPGDILTVTESVVGAVEKANTFIYLHGEVNSPGGYEFREGLTVEKAVALAGGFSPRASKKRINITREAAEDNEPEKLKRVKLFFDLKPGDVIHIGESWF